MPLNSGLLNKVAQVPASTPANVAGSFYQGMAQAEGRASAKQDRQLKAQQIKVSEWKMSQEEQKFIMDQEKLERDKKMAELAKPVLLDSTKTTQEIYDEVRKIKLNHATTTDEINTIEEEYRAGLENMADIEKNIVELRKTESEISKNDAMRGKYEAETAQVGKSTPAQPAEAQRISAKMTQMEEAGQKDSPAYKRLEARHTKLTTTTGATEYDAGVTPTNQEPDYTYSPQKFESSIVGQLHADPTNAGAYGRAKDFVSGVASNVPGAEGLVSESRARYKSETEFLRTELYGGLREAGIRSKDHINMILDKLPNPKSIAEGAPLQISELISARKQLEQVIETKMKDVNSGMLTKSQRGTTVQALNKLDAMLDKIAPPIPVTREEFDSIPPKVLVAQFKQATKSEFMQMLQDGAASGSGALQEGTPEYEAIMDMYDDHMKGR